MKQTNKLEVIDINKLIPYANNARTHSDEQIKKIQSSLREFGFVNPVLIDKSFSIIAGHGRVEAAKREGLTECPCVMVEHLSEAQKKAYILADNKLAELSSWDMDMVKIELEELQELDFDIELTGFEMQDNEIDVEPIDDENITSNNISEHTMTIDKTKITLTEEEYNLINSKLDMYIDDNGVSFGFIRWLLND